MTLTTRYILVGVTGGLSALGFTFPFLWPLILVGLSGFLFILWFLTRSILESVIQGFIFGIITAGAIIALFLATLPIEWFADTKIVQILSVVILWTLVSSALALGTVFVAPILFFIRTLPVKAITLPTFGGVIWAIQEYIRMLLFGFITLGDNSLPGAHFSVTAFGHAFTEHIYFLQFAQWLGIYSLSFAVAVLAGCLAVLLHAILRQQTYTSLITLVFGILFLTLPLLPKDFPALQNPLSIAVITVDGDSAPQESFFENILNEVHAKEVDVVIFPETIDPPWFKNATTREYLREHLKDQNTLFIYSRYQIDSKKPGKAELVYEYLDGRIIYYQKRFLMPLSEYVPSITSTVFAPFASSRVKEYTQNSAHIIVRGEEPAPVVTHNNVPIGALLCAETVSPVLYSGLARQNARLLATLSTTSWFDDGKRVTRLLTSIATIHAVQHRSYFVLASKGSVSSIIAPSGEIIIQSEPDTNSVIIQTLR